MGVRFIHAADIHLGYEQYNCEERCFDFALAFQRLTDQALAQRVQFLILAGDLFNKHAINPRTLLQATRQLQRLHADGIPVIAVQGNHEQPHYHERYSWLDYLAHQDLLTLLSITYQDGKPSLVPWDLARHTGSYVDLPGGIRIVGSSYVGASTSRLVEDLAPALSALPGSRPAYTILVLHAGLEGILPGVSGGLTRAQLNPLRDHVDYLALGHIHKPFEQDDWIYNPGSLETNSVDEAAWEERGYYLVECDPSKGRDHCARKVVSPRRPFLRLELEVDPYPTPDALYQAFGSKLTHQGRALDGPQQPVVHVRLSGVLSFAHSDLDTGRLESIASLALNPIGQVEMHDEVTAPGELPTLPEGLSRAELERRVLSDLVESDLRCRGQGAQWAEMVLQLKQMALGRSTPERIVAELRAFQATLGEEQPVC
jgi:DNA repair protein SbcD/Mre11